MGVAVSGEGDRFPALDVADLALRVCARGELGASEAATLESLLIMLLIPKTGSHVFRVLSVRGHVRVSDVSFRFGFLSQFRLGP